MNRTSLLLLTAWLVAMAATGSALFIGEVMGMVPCVLCWYQRIAMFPLALILGMALYSEDRRGATYALPLALAGAAVACYHSLLLIRPQEVSTCRVFNLGITEEAFYALR